MDFRNNMQKVYVTEEQKEKVMEKLKRDVEVGDMFVCRTQPHGGAVGLHQDGGDSVHWAELDLDFDIKLQQKWEEQTFRSCLIMFVFFRSNWSYEVRTV